MALPKKGNQLLCGRRSRKEQLPKAMGRSHIEKTQHGVGGAGKLMKRVWEEGKGEHGPELQVQV